MAGRFRLVRDGRCLRLSETFPEVTNLIQHGNVPHVVSALAVFADYCGSRSRLWTRVAVKIYVYLVASLFLLAAVSSAADNLRLNPRLHYDSDSNDGPLITGDNIEAGVTSGMPAYVILYGEGCYNSKRQARRTVSLYEKYKGRVQFVVIDLDRKLSPAQAALEKKYYRGYIPHVVVLNRAGAALYNSSGEVEEEIISGLLDKALE